MAADLPALGDFGPAVEALLGGEDISDILAEDDNDDEGDDIYAYVLAAAFISEHRAMGPSAGTRQQLDQHVDIALRDLGGMAKLKKRLEKASPGRRRRGVARLVARLP